MDALIEPRTVERDAGELTQQLQAVGVASYPVIDALGALADPQLAARRELVRVTAPGIAASELFTANPWRMSETPSTIHTPAKPVGEDNEFVLREVLGMSDEEIARVTAPPQATEVT